MAELKPVQGVFPAQAVFVSAKCVTMSAGLRLQSENEKNYEKE